MDEALEYSKGDVVHVKVPGQPRRRYLVTDCRTTGDDSVELELLADPEDEPSPHVWRRAP